MPNRVGGVLQHRLGDPVVIHHARALGDLHEQPLPVTERLHLGLDVEHQLSRVGRPGRHEVGLLRLRQHEQIADDAAHPPQLAVHEIEGLAPLLRIVGQQLEMAAHDRDRGPQFMSGVVDELPLRRVRILDTVQHRVEGLGQRGHVVAADHRDPCGEVVLADLRGDHPHTADRRQDPARDQIRHAGGDDHPGQADDRQHTHRAVNQFPARVGVDADDEGPRLRRARRRVDRAATDGRQIHLAPADLTMRSHQDPGRPALGTQFVEHTASLARLRPGITRQFEDLGVADDAGHDLPLAGRLPRQEHLEQP